MKTTFSKILNTKHTPEYSDHDELRCDLCGRKTRFEEGNIKNDFDTRGNVIDVFMCDKCHITIVLIGISYELKKIRDKMKHPCSSREKEG